VYREGVSRSLSWVLVAVAACGDDSNVFTCEYAGETYRIGDRFPSTDGCNSCSCTHSGISCTALACVPNDALFDADPAYCGPTNGCPVGPACGSICCGPGERCTNGVCQCGTGAACTSGNRCEAAGPVGQDGCGSVCCGASGPCPQ
jgi:hypothetical protein